MRLAGPVGRGANDPNLKAQIVRIVAVEDDTNLTYDPDFGAPTTIASAGQWIELPMSTQAFELESDKKVLVAQYMVGQSADSGLADPAMVLAVAAVGGRAWIYTLREQDWVATEVLTAGLVNLQDVTWSPDGSVLLGGALAGRTRLWLTDVDTAAEWVCAGVGQHVTEEEWDGLLPGIDYAPPCAGAG